MKEEEEISQNTLQDSEDILREVGDIRSTILIA